MEQRVSLVTLGVANTAKARAFYEALGWSGETPDGDVVFFQSGGMIVALWGRDQLVDDSTVIDNGGWGCHPRPQRSVSRRGRFDPRCCPKGWRFDRPLRSSDGLGRILRIFIDPDGHPWEVAFNPGWRLESDGTIHLH